MAFTIVDPRDPTQDTNLPPPNVYQGNPPLPPVAPAGLRPAVPAPQVAATPQAGNANFWDFMRNLFMGQQVPAGGQGMTGLLQPHGRSGMSADVLGNPLRRY